MAQTDQDLKPPLRERTPGEKRAYQQGYVAALELMRRRLQAMEATARIEAGIFDRQANL